MNGVDEMDRTQEFGRCEATGHLVYEATLISVMTENGEELHCKDCFQMKVTIRIQRSEVPAVCLNGENGTYLHYFYILDEDGKKSNAMVSIEADYYLFELNSKYKVTIKEIA